MNDKIEYPDFVNEQLFKRYSIGAERIQFGDAWKARPDEDKIEYLIKLASSLNQAAVKIQEERNKLNAILFTKENQLVACNKGRTQDREMIQKQLLRENETKEKLIQENQSLRAEIKRLENGDKH